MQINIKKNNCMEIVTNNDSPPLIVTRVEAYQLLDLLEKQLWDKESHMELESQIDQLEYELDMARNEIKEMEETEGMTPQEMSYYRDY